MIQEAGRSENGSNADGSSAVAFSNQTSSLYNVDSIDFTPNTGPVPAGLLTAAQGRKGSVTSFTYNSAGDLLTTTDPVGLVTTKTYDALGVVERAVVKDPPGRAEDAGLHCAQRGHNRPCGLRRTSIDGEMPQV
jgi:YD repeat-containing protein